MIVRAYDKWWEKEGWKYWSRQDWNPTNEQKKIIYKAIQAVKKGYRNIVIHAGTGIGKSAISTMLMNYFNSAYVLTTTTQLQDQYMDDFGDDLVELKGKSNYECHYGGGCDKCYIKYVNKHRTPDLDIRLKELNTHGRHFTFIHDLDSIHDEDEAVQAYWEKVANLRLWYCNDCPYQLAREKAKRNPYIVCNNHSLYFNSVIYPIFDKRDSIFFDEAHNLEKFIADMHSIKINPKKIYEESGVNILEYDNYNDLKKINYWIKIFNEIIFNLKLLKQKELEEYKDILDKVYLDQIGIEYDHKISIYQKYITLLENEYVVNVPFEKDLYDDSKNKIVLEPIFCKNLCDDFFNMGNICFFLSATLPKYESYFDELGVSSDSIYYIHEESPYHETNRPIIFKPLGRFSSKNKYKSRPAYTNPKVIIGLKEILDNHDGENIIIFFESIDQCDFLCDELFEYNPLSAYDDNRNDAIELFKESNDHHLLISPSISEGVDFKGDDCTVQIIFKMPYPPQTGRLRYRVKKLKDWDYYNRLVVIKLEQMYGRSIRSMDDRCVTYIVDEAFNNLLSRNVGFSNYFLGGLDFGKQGMDILTDFFDF